MSSSLFVALFVLHFIRHLSFASPLPLFHIHFSYQQKKKKQVLSRHFCVLPFSFRQNGTISLLLSSSPSYCSCYSTFCCCFCFCQHYNLPTSSSQQQQQQQQQEVEWEWLEKKKRKYLSHFHFSLHFFAFHSWMCFCFCFCFFLPPPLSIPFLSLCAFVMRHFYITYPPLNSPPLFAVPVGRIFLSQNGF